MKNETFANEKERLCWLKMQQFNKKLGLDELGRAPEKHYSDASGITPALEVVTIELKDRDCNLIGTSLGYGVSGKTWTGTTLYIENHKAADLLMDYVAEGKLPLYINFLNDDTVVAYNLSKLRKRPKTVAKKIWSELYQGFELSKRMELELSDAFIYKWDGNKWETMQKGWTTTTRD